MDFDIEAVLASFLVETEEGLNLMEQSLLAMEANPSDPELLPNIFRVAHSLKGNATSLDFKELAGFAHIVEDLLDVLRQQQAVPGPELVSLLLQAVDELRAMVPRFAAGARELTAGQQKLRKQIAREVQRRAKRVVTLAESSGEISAAPTLDSLPGITHRTLRADVDRLDHILNLTGEIVTAQNRLRLMIEKVGTEEGHALLEMHREAERLYMELQGEVMRIRLVPVGPLFRQFARQVRDLAKSHGKLARLEVIGADVEVDTTVLENLKDPLLHLLRNAVDHGLELPAARQGQGKNPCGVIRLSAAHSGGNVIVKLEDDGAGFSRTRILEKAKRMGLLSDKDHVRDQDLYELVFQAGFSTAESVTELSGRGVGLDVVRRNIDALRGTVEISSEEGKGTTITVRLPLTLTMIEGFSVTVSDETFVVPLEYVTECIELPAEQRRSEASGILNLRGRALPYVRLRDMFRIPGNPPKKENIVVVKMNEFHAGIAVDRLLGGMQTVVKPLGRALRGVVGVTGSTVLGDGRVGLIVDVPSLLRGVTKSALQLQVN
jgi:two-component system chemotaxis sensor kinase CheA